MEVHTTRPDHSLEISAFLRNSLAAGRDPSNWLKYVRVTIRTVPQELPSVSAGAPPVGGFIHLPEKPSGDALALTHGAGGDCNGVLLVILANSFAAAGLTVLRCDLPFRRRRPHGPPHPGDAERDQEGLSQAVALLRQRSARRVFLGGHSYGGRQATLLLAAQAGLADGLLLLSYPLYMPGQPSRQRKAHFPNLTTPALFIHGTRDPFGTIEELQAAVSLIPAPTRLLAVETAGHNLLTKHNREQLPQVIVQAFHAHFHLDRTV